MLIIVQGIVRKQLSLSSSYRVTLVNSQMLHLCPGIREKCIDSLVFETMIPKPMMLHYISLLLKHKRLVLSGPSGTGKTYLAHRLARYLLERSRADTEVDRESSRSSAVTFNMHHQSQKVPPFPQSGSSVRGHPGGVGSGYGAVLTR